LTSLRLSKVALLALLALFSTSAPAALVTFTVNSTSDFPDNIFDGVCADAFGKCTLRAAIMEANNLGKNETDGYRIVLPAGTYALTRGVTNPDDHSNGDLDVDVSIVRIYGAGASATIIDANHLDRAFKVAKSGFLVLNDLTVQNGQPPSLVNRSKSGGAILVVGSLYLTGCVLDSNTSGFRGGAIAAESDNNTPSVTAVRTTFSRNAAYLDGGGFGGLSTSALFDACTFASNTATNGGGTYHSGGHLDMQNSTLFQNEADNSGGGIYLSGIT
jgi:predicted outer membrane repeat protein